MALPKTYIAALAIGCWGAGAQAQQGVLDPDLGSGTGAVLYSITQAEYLSGVDVAVQPDGGIVVVATAMMSGLDRIAVVRFLSDGTLDPDFGESGLVLSSNGFLNDDAHAVVLQPDGYIVVAGTRATSPQGTGSTILMRLAPDGMLDTDFGTDGVVITSPPGGWRIGANALALSPSGKIIVAGTAELTGGDTQAYVAKYLSDGTPDPGFGDGDGYVKQGLGFMGSGYFREQLQGVTVTSNGSIVAVGGCLMPNAPGASAFRMKLHPDGDLDGFGGSYFSWTDGPNWANSVARMPSGDHLVIGRGSGAGPQMTYMHLEDDGDEAESGALLMIDQGPHNSTGYDVALTEDGVIYLAGTIEDEAGHHFGIARLEADCGEDATFGTNGHLMTPLGTDGLAEARGVALQPDGRVVLVGFAVSNGRTELALARYLPDGTTSIAAAPVAATTFEAYPNPATDQLTVRYDLAANGPVSIDLLDAVGHVVGRPVGMALRSAGEQRETFRLPALSNGAYLLRLSDADGTRVARVVVDR